MAGATARIKILGKAAAKLCKEVVNAKGEWEKKVGRYVALRTTEY